MSVHYDYIITGTGCAGLSLAMHMIQSEKLKEKKVLLIDRDAKQKNDRTWCFWETAPGLFESIVYKQWEKAWIYGKEFSKLLDLSPFQYKLIRGIDFYHYCLEQIIKHPSFCIKTGNVQHLKTEGDKGVVVIDDQIFTADYIFNSILFEKPVLKEKEYYLLQHFKGKIINTEADVFDPGHATLMDFRVPQQNGTTFVYVMPFSRRQALIEYTLFSESLLEPSVYDKELNQYINGILRIQDFTVTEEEFGVIPMTNHKFPSAIGRVVNIGTAGGQTKASSGYTFQFIQKHSARIVENLVKRNNPFIPMPAGPRRFRFYDSTLLYILKNGSLPGHTVFTTLFKKNKPQQVLRFLDNESSFMDELKIISSLPTLPFLKAALKQR